ncbi:C6 zinc finger domain [Cordyceps militaris]|uniref:C6 zinc finger domain n=1 Tax=Cordyceps militaris TaxID=73501 RepID=A0A2H4SU37_CORMI|nr:C6 zinc finger domain [Cordyceps militaris]
MQSACDQRMYRRSRSGCRTCRLKKVKCDEVRPQCQRCGRLRRFCDYSNQDEVYVSAVGKPGRANWGEMTIQLPAFSTSTCSLSLTTTDHEAIRYFRTTFARRHHTKNPDFSVYSIIFNIAQFEPLAMHAVLALACRAIQPRDQLAYPNHQQNWRHLVHYSSALGRLKEELEKGSTSQEAFNFDVCFTVLYIMMVYEQNFGGDSFAGLAHHLDGAATVLRHRGKHIKRDVEAVLLATPLAIDRHGLERGLSLYSARILIWISLCDATSATYGIGGSFNAALTEVLGRDDPGGVEHLHTFSNSLFRVMWADAYPQAELVDDIENRSVFELMVACSRARYSLAVLARSLKGGNVQESKLCTKSAKEVIQFIATRYRELLEVASGLLPSTDHAQRLVANLRGIVPHYHAVVVVFARLAANFPGTPIHAEPQAHVKSIMTLARQAYRHQGSDAMVRVAWPLLVVFLETQDQATRDWILCRFQSMASLNKNMERAEDFLRNSVGPARATSAAWADPGSWFHSGDGAPFII